MGYSGSFYNYCTYRPGNCLQQQARDTATGAVRLVGCPAQAKCG